MPADVLADAAELADGVEESCGVEAAGAGEAALLLARLQGMCRSLGRPLASVCLPHAEARSAERVRALKGMQVGASLVDREVSGVTRARGHQLSDPTSLSPRELEVLRRVMDGRTPMEIALAHRVSLPTVRTQLRAVYRKLGVRNMVEAVIVGERRGYAHPLKSSDPDDPLAHP